MLFADPTKSVSKQSPTNFLKKDIQISVSGSVKEILTHHWDCNQKRMESWTDTESQAEKR